MIAERIPNDQENRTQTNSERAHKGSGRHEDGSARMTQKQVSEALDSLKCTRLVIAHRLSTIKHCDRILVLDQGCIIEDGTYEELIAENGLFAELVDRQRLDV